MAFEVEWSGDAVEDFEEIITWLEQHWSEEIAADFAIRVSEVIQILQKMPFAYRVISKKRAVRRCVISKQTSMFYKVQKNKVILLAFFDSRQNPDELLIF